MENKIRLRVRNTVKKDEDRVVRISGEANVALTEIYRATGLPITYIVSQMILQGAKLVEIVEEVES